MSRQDRSAKLTAEMEARTRASVAEILYQIARTLTTLKGSEHLSVAQQGHVDTARSHIDAAVDEWMDGALSGDRPCRSTRAHAAALGSPMSSERGLNAVLEILVIYDEDIDERDFTPMQLQRLMIAGHNLFVVAEELRKSVH